MVSSHDSSSSHKRLLDVRIWASAGGISLIILASSCQGVIAEGAGEFSPGDPPPIDDTPFCTAGPPLTGESQRLSPTEASNAIEVALGFRPDVTGLPVPSTSGGFATYPGANRIEQDQIGDIADVADAVGIEAIDHLSELLSCDPAGIDEICVETFVAEYGPRFSRGAFDVEDRDRLVELYRQVRRDPDALDPELAVASVISAMIQSPGFLYLIEAGEPSATPNVRRLTGEETANRMAFMFWDGPADSLLQTAALEGRLQTAEGRRAEAERMLMDDAARPAVVQFFRDWFHVDDADMSDRVGAELNQAWNEEFRRLVENIVFEGGSGTVQDLVTSQQTFVNRTLAEHYGLSEVPADDATWTHVTLPEELQGGLLSRALFAAALSATEGTSIIRRGHFVREELICGQIANPPPGVTEMNPVLPPGASVRERSEARSDIALCGSCHSQMDPIGIGMEDIDQDGLSRLTYRDGQTVDSAGVVEQVEGSTSFNGTAELGVFLASSPEFSECSSRQWFRFAMGRDVGSTCHSNLSREAISEAEGDLRELLLAVVESESFVLRTDAVQR